MCADQAVASIVQPGKPALRSAAANRATEEGFTLLIKPYQPDALLAAISEVTAAGPHTESNVIPLADGAMKP